RGAETAMEAALLEGLRDHGLEEIGGENITGIEWREILLPFPLHRANVERIRDISYWRRRGLNLKLDIYRGWDKPSGCPVLLQVHGGAWILGTKNEQGVPLMRRMARHGWVC